MGPFFPCELRRAAARSGAPASGSGPDGRAPHRRPGAAAPEPPWAFFFPGPISAQVRGAPGPAPSPTEALRAEPAPAVAPLARPLLAARLASLRGKVGARGRPARSLTRAGPARGAQARGLAPKGRGGGGGPDSRRRGSHQRPSENGGGGGGGGPEKKTRSPYAAAAEPRGAG